MKIWVEITILDDIISWMLCEQNQGHCVGYKSLSLFSDEMVEFWFLLYLTLDNKLLKDGKVGRKSYIRHVSKMLKVQGNTQVKYVINILDAPNI